MAKHAPVVEHSGNRVTVVAPTAEEAMALVGDAGPGYRTTSIGKVRRGGLAGFFATELVRVVAEAPGAAPAPRDAPASLQLATADDLIASLCGTDGPFAGRLAAGLHRSFVDPPPTNQPDAPIPRTDPGPPDPAPLANFGAQTLWAKSERQSSALAPVAAAGPAGAMPTERIGAAVATDDRRVGSWSAAALEAVGLPASIVARAAGVRPYDEVTWNAALMLALRDWCGAELPVGAVLAGPACGPLARALRVPVVDAADLGEREGPLAVTDADGTVLSASARPVHLVVGAAWHHLGTVRPAAVSAATPADLVAAVRIAAAWDAPLGWVHDGTAVRIDPFLVAARLRALLAPATRPAAPSARRPPAPGRKAAAGTARPDRLPATGSKTTSTPAVASK